MNRPNILILYADQHRWDALGANGNSEILTPYLDQLASAGVSFERCFVQHPLCMPSRASFLTGRYPRQLGITHMGVPVPQETETIAHLFSQYGYRTANIGKLHFLPHANRDHRLPHPRYGFDQLEISDEPGVYEDAYRAWVRHQDRDQLKLIEVGLPPARATWVQEMGPQAEGYHQMVGRADFERVIPFEGDPDLTHTAFVAERTMAFLDQHQAGSNFLCVAGFYSPHAPLIVPARFLDLYDREQLSLPDYPPAADITRREMGWGDDYLREMRHGYYAMISEVDHHIGRIIQRLKVNGQYENTIILYTADHGEWLGDHLRFGKGYPGDDAVTRVPLVLSTPHVQTREADRSALIEALDVLPTLLEAAGIQVPPTLQGCSFLDLLKGDGKYEPRRSALTEADGWKSIRTARFRYLVESNGSEWLWDLDDRYGDYTNLAAEPEMASILAAHRKEMLRRLIQDELPLPRTWPY